MSRHLHRAALVLDGPAQAQGSGHGAHQRAEHRAAEGAQVYATDLNAEKLAEKGGISGAFFTGMLAAFVGAPFFIWIVRRARVREL